MRNLMLVVLPLFLFACTTKIKVDLIVANTTIYTVDSAFTTAACMAIHNGKIVRTGRCKDINNNYSSDSVVDFSGLVVLPGLLDAHSHFFGLAKSLITVDLRGVASEEEMIQRVVDFYKSRKPSVVLGRGWDQNLWTTRDFPNRNRIDEIFPNVPVVLTRIDGHALLANKAAMALGKIKGNEWVSGGEVVVENGIATGIFIDNAMDLVQKGLPDFSESELREALKLAQYKCLSEGLTGVSDAGLDIFQIELLKKMMDEQNLEIRIYAMANGDQNTIDHFLAKGPIITDRLVVRSFKYYMDGAMGSRGACLINDYNDRPGHRGTLINDPANLDSVCRSLAPSKFQLNVHCIGDSALRVTLNGFAKVLNPGNDQRWRIEHVQLYDPDDLHQFRKYKLIPSMQPTHATSDAAWVQDRIGGNRLHYAYALKNLLETCGSISLGTDFPVEPVNPLHTFYAAVTRTNPHNGITFPWMQTQELSRRDALKGMTIWAAFAQFEETTRGSLEPGKSADFIVLDRNILNCEVPEILNAQVKETWIGGKPVYRQ